MLTTPQVSIVVPTCNEAGNVAEVVDQLHSVMPSEVQFEIIFVDDSTDQTPQVISAVAQRHDTPISLLHREVPDGGLGGAVLEGFRRARGEWVIVMDGDLQHPPEVIPALLSAGNDDAAELVVATRYASGGGSNDGLSSGTRQLISQLCTVVAHLLFPRLLRGVSDPMSGFFLMRATAINLTSLRPLGYKILLELLVRTRPKHIVEVPYRFQERHEGKSKSSLREGLRFFRHLTRLRLSTIDLAGTPVGRKLAFGAVGLSGFLPNLSMVWLLTAVLTVPYALAAVLATEVAIGWNFLLIDRVFTGACRWGWWWRFGSFAVLNNADLLWRIPLLVLLVDSTRLPLLPATAVTLLVSFAARFIITDRLIYLRARPAPRAAQRQRWGRRGASHRDAQRLDHVVDGDGLGVAVHGQVPAGEFGG
ncbi:MAG: dolichol-phosphate mannosyltransferase [Pseudonocardiales bacterium]|nr:MAG: dolichol-phosphate mannosyltransferase [Pseudonocardiales bacterium]